MIPDEARTSLHNLRTSFGDELYLDAVWRAREVQHQGATKPVGKWPFVRACDRQPEAVVDVAHLPAKLRSLR